MPEGISKIEDNGGVKREANLKMIADWLSFPPGYYEDIEPGDFIIAPREKQIELIKKVLTNLKVDMRKEGLDDFIRIEIDERRKVIVYEALGLKLLTPKEAEEFIED